MLERESVSVSTRAPRVHQSYLMHLERDPQSSYAALSYISNPYGEQIRGYGRNLRNSSERKGLADCSVLQFVASESQSYAFL
jgi:hypothetical protein